ncbi:pyrroloquinoline-quinone synthase PqqC [Ensifer sp. IC3342]|nr:pyrroloquinoline-quinone synthase PqqC [Ensifer sp. IC3342]
MTTAADREAFHARLLAIGQERYHDKHPFHTLLHGGRATMTQVRAWVINRYYYQIRIPMKDAALLSRCDDPDLRRAWRSRIEDHDGGLDEGGGIRRWLRLAQAVGLDPAYVASTRGVLPATRFAVDAYVAFVREKPLIEAVASSLTELFAPKIHSERIAGLLAHYAFADDAALAYFRQRLTEAPRDVEFGLAYVLDHADTAEKQDAAAAALTFKTDVLWSQLDALYCAYVTPGLIPPGVWDGEQGVVVRPTAREAAAREAAE